MKLHTADDKRTTIVTAALDVFINYGFKKTSMDDIARAAGMSRPALYQTFRNKTEIFRALSLSMMDTTAKQARNAFKGKKPFKERMFDALDLSILSLHRKIDETAHGAELMGVNEEIAGDIEERWCDSMIEVFTEAISAAEASGEISLSNLGVDAKTVGSIVMQAMEGMKASCLRGNEIEPDVRKLITFVANALTAGVRG